MRGSATVLVFAIALDSGAQASAWTSEVVLENGIQRQTAIAVDDAGTPWVAWHGPGVMVADKPGASWLARSLAARDCLTMGGPEIEPLGPGGEPMLAWVDSAALWLSSWDGVAWNSEMVDGTIADAWWLVSLARDRAGNPAIAYLDLATSTLSLARRVGAVWSIERVESAVVNANRASGVSLAFDLSDRPLLAIAGPVGASPKVRLLSWTGSAWSEEETGATGTTSTRALGIDRTGDVWLLVADTSEIQLWRRSGTGWAIAATSPFTPGGGGGDPSLAIAPDDTRWLGWSDADGVHAGHHDSSGLGTWRVSSSSDARNLSLALDPAGLPRLAWITLDPEVQFAQFDGISWSIEAVAAGFDAGHGSSLAYDALGHAMVSHLDRVRGEIRVERWNGGAWQRELVASAGIPVGTSLATSSGSIREALAWVDADAHTLLVAWNNAGTWSAQSPDPAAVVDDPPSLKLDSLGHPVVAYRGDDELKIARWNGSSWSPQATGTPLPYSITHLALALDDLDRPAVAWGFQRNCCALAVTTWDGVAWITEYPETTTSFPDYRDVDAAYSPSGSLVVATLRQSQVRVARKLPTGWQVDAIAAFGQSVAVAFDPGGEPVVAYTFTGGVAVATPGGSGWSIELVHGYSTLVRSEVDVALSPSGLICVAHGVTCENALELACGTLVPATYLHRRPVTSVLVGWKDLALPLTAANDDETPPFPQSVVVPGSSQDPIASSEPLVLYRLSSPGNSLKLGPDLSISY